jgi:WD40 repeat protein
VEGAQAVTTATTATTPRTGHPGDEEAHHPNSQLISRRHRYTLRIWDPQTGRGSHTRTAHDGGVWSLAVGPHGRWLASAGYDGTVRIWDPNTGQARHLLTGHTSGVRALTVAPDGRWLASAGDDGTVRIWDAGAGRSVVSLRTGHPLSHIASDGVRVIVAGDRSPYFIITAGC